MMINFQKYIQMQWLVILIVLPSVRNLVCPTFYDYTGDTVTCQESCPSTGIAKSNKCITKNQYLIGEEVHLCDRGWVDSTNSICCSRKQYIQIYNGALRCSNCHTKVYGNGKLCCPGSFYADLSTANSFKCTTMGKGSCPSITIKSILKVCCPSGLFYNLDQQNCVFPLGYNCEPNIKICCGLGRKLQYIGDEYLCVSNCRWGDNSSFYCQQQYCNSYNESIAVSQFENKQNQTKISVKSQCCYGLSDTGTLINNMSNCSVRFRNRNWAVCCQPGQFYSPKIGKCSRKCEGIIVLQFFCISVGTILSLQGSPTEVQTQLCNGKLVPTKQPYCCPSGFYIFDSNGCTLCNGRIFITDTRQFCCLFDQIFNQITQQCETCRGVVNSEGNICCLSHQYFSYSISGKPACTDSCPQQKMYRTNYCCESLVNPSCQLKGLSATLCNTAYLIENACQSCPTFCSLQGRQAEMCSTNNGQNNCVEICEPGTIYWTEVGQCLSCDTSCLQCSQPLDGQYCTKCQEGYTKVAGKCNRCAPGCATCSITVSTCDSCAVNGSKPLLINGMCLPDCGSGNYLEMSTASCATCDSSCLECVGSRASQCSKCPASFLLNTPGIGFCMSCATGCLQCFLSSNRCFRCAEGMSLDQNRQCVASCLTGSMSLYDPSLKGSICLACHSSCNGCQLQPQNCIGCANANSYLSDETGLNLCYACPPACSSCTSEVNCLACLAGFTLQNGACISVGCSSICTQCDSNNNCLICQTPYYLYNGSCVSQCPYHYYLLNTKCLKCEQNCTSCISQNQCLTCSLGFPLKFEELCLAACPIGFHDLFGTCYKDSNNNDSYSSNITVVGIKQQSVELLGSSKSLLVTTILNSTFNGTTQLEFKLLNTKSNTSIPLIAVQTRLAATQMEKLQANPQNVLAYSLVLPTDTTLADSILLTSVKGNPNSSIYFNGRSFFDFITYDYIQDPLRALQYVGLSFTILISIFAIITKLKGHFIAEESNNVILHMLNFIQVVYLFKFTQLHSQGMYHFLNGFGYMHYLMFPNFFYGAIPSGYQQYPAEKSLIPDANFIRNAGSSVSFMLVAAIIMGMAAIVSLLLYKMKDLTEMPQIRKITRIGILAIHITFMNIVFAAITFLLQPTITPNSFFYNQTRAAAIIMLIIIIGLCLGIGLHFYKTYNSDVLEHYYTLRQTASYLLIICQAVIFSFSIGKILLCLFLILLEFAWFGFNFLLYKYGEGDSIKKHIKFIIASLCISIAYLFLSLSTLINWIVIVVIVSLVVAILIIYSVYQVVGLYYNLLFKQKQQVKSDEGTQVKQVKLENDKQSASKL